MHVRECLAIAFGGATSQMNWGSGHGHALTSSWGGPPLLPGGAGHSPVAITTPPMRFRVEGGYEASRATTRRGTTRTVRSVQRAPLLAR